MGRWAGGAGDFGDRYGKAKRLPSRIRTREGPIARPTCPSAHFTCKTISYVFKCCPSLPASLPASAPNLESPRYPDPTAHPKHCACNGAPRIHPNPPSHVPFHRRRATTAFLLPGAAQAFRRGFATVGIQPFANVQMSQPAFARTWQPGIGISRRRHIQSPTTYLPPCRV